MGIVDNVGFTEFPKQGKSLNQRVVVCFRYDASKTIGGVCVREDSEAPYEMIFKLDDGRYILSTECMWRPE